MAGPAGGGSGSVVSGWLPPAIFGHMRRGGSKRGEGAGVGGLGFVDLLTEK
jgi:hypothetical protein